MTYVPLASLFLMFLIDIAQQMFLELSPCSAPWMTALPDGACTFRDSVSVMHLVLGAAVVVVGGIVGAISAVITTGERRLESLACALICFVGAFSRLFVSWSFIRANL